MRSGKSLANVDAQRECRVVNGKVKRHQFKSKKKKREEEDDYMMKNILIIILGSPMIMLLRSH